MESFIRQIIQVDTWWGSYNRNEADTSINNKDNDDNTTTTTVTSNLNGDNSGDEVAPPSPLYSEDPDIDRYYRYLYERRVADELEERGGDDSDGSGGTAVDGDEDGDEGTEEGFWMDGGEGRRGTVTGDNFNPQHITALRGFRGDETFVVDGEKDMDYAYGEYHEYGADDGYQLGDEFGVGDEYGVDYERGFDEGHPDDAVQDDGYAVDEEPYTPSYGVEAPDFTADIEKWNQNTSELQHPDEEQQNKVTRIDSQLAPPDMARIAICMSQASSVYSSASSYPSLSRGPSAGDKNGLVIVVTTTTTAAFSDAEDYNGCDSVGGWDEDNMSMHSELNSNYITPISSAASSSYKEYPLVTVLSPDLSTSPPPPSRSGRGSLWKLNSNSSSTSICSFYSAHSTMDDSYGDSTAGGEEPPRRLKLAQFGNSLKVPLSHVSGSKKMDQSDGFKKAAKQKKRERVRRKLGI